jgi:hypothetical protein
MDTDAMLKIPAHVLPWVLTLVVVLILLAILAVAGFDNWSELQ